MSENVPVQVCEHCEGWEQSKDKDQKKGFAWQCSSALKSSQR